MVHIPIGHKMMLENFSKLKCNHKSQASSFAAEFWTLIFLWRHFYGYRHTVEISKFPQGMNEQLLKVSVSLS